MSTQRGVSLYTVAFAEQVQQPDQCSDGSSHLSADNIDTVLALLCNSDDFPPLSGLNTRSSSLGNRSEIKKEWHMVHQQDMDTSDDGLTVASFDDTSGKYSQHNSDNDSSVSCSSSWRHVNYSSKSKQSFADIASKAGQDHIPIPNERFFKQYRQKQRQRSVKKSTSNILLAINEEKEKIHPSSHKNNGDNINKNVDDEDAYYYDDLSVVDNYNEIKERRRITESEKQRAIHRRQKRINVIFHHRIRTLPKILDQRGLRKDEFKTHIQAIQSKHKEFTKEAYNEGYRLFQSSANSYSRKTGQRRSKGNKKKKTQDMVKDDARRILLNEMETYNMIDWQHGERVTYEREEQAIRELKYTLYFLRYGPLNFREWADYDEALATLRQYINIEYKKLTRLFTSADEREIKGLQRLLYKQLPRIYYEPGQRKYRKQNIRYFLEHHFNNQISQ